MSGYDRCRHCGEAIIYYHGEWHARNGTIRCRVARRHAP